MVGGDGAPSTAQHPAAPEDEADEAAPRARGRAPRRRWRGSGNKPRGARGREGRRRSTDRRCGRRTYGARGRAPRGTRRRAPPCAPPPRSRASGTAGRCAGRRRRAARGRERIALPISPRKCSPAMATALRRSLEVQSTIASQRSAESAMGSTGTPQRMSSRLNAACMLAWAASWRRKASPSARRAASATRGSRRRASSMKKPSTTGAIAESASRNAVGPMPAGCQARGTSCSRPSKSKPGRRGVTVMPRVQVEVGSDVRSFISSAAPVRILRHTRMSCLSHRNSPVSRPGHTLSRGRAHIT